MAGAFFFKIYVDRAEINKYFLQKSKSAIIILAHEGSHYTYATRHGLLSFWWRQYEVEGYRISDILSLELTGKNWGIKLKETEIVDRTKVHTVDNIETFLKNNLDYKWIPEFPFTFNYWNKENIGQ